MLQQQHPGDATAFYAAAFYAAALYVASRDNDDAALATLQGVVERRITPDWFIGVGVDIQQAKDYTPSHGLIYVRYSAAGWEGGLDMPPQPLTPKADFK